MAADKMDTALRERLAPDLAKLKNAQVLVTGAAGFIGHAVSRALAEAGIAVTGMDNLSETIYPRPLKSARLKTLEQLDRFYFVEADLCEPDKMARLFKQARPTHVVHLAAHAAVLPSFDAPLDYVTSNVIGTQVLLEEARRANLAHLVYASTSSVYGRNKDGEPFREDQPTHTPISVYGASKIANEAMMQVYMDMYGLSVTGLRFFKVYGPWGRPDTVFFKFVDRIHRGEPVVLRNFGDIHHAFTYIDDVVQGVIAALARPPEQRDGERHPVYNLGNPDSENLGECVDIIEQAMGVTAERKLEPLPPGDRFFSRADIDHATRELGYEVRVPVVKGIPRLVEWYEEEYAPLGVVSS